MRYSQIFILILFLSLPNAAYSQKIVKIYKDYVLINIGPGSGIKGGSKVSILKKLQTGKLANIGEVVVIRFYKGRCIGKVISEKAPYRVEVGDFVKIPNIRNKRSNILFYSLVGAGIIAAGSAFLFHSQANQTFGEYEAAQTTADAVRLYDKTVSFDTKSRISLGVAGGLVIAGVVTYLLNHSRKPSFSKYSYSIEPVNRQKYVGLRLKLDLDNAGKK